MKTSVLIGGILLAAQSAWASGGYSCSVHDSNINLEVGGGLSHGIPGMPFSNHGRLTFSNPALSSFDIPAFPESGPALFWIDDKELKIKIYKEDYSAREFQTLNMLVETVYQEEPNLDSAYKGTYLIRLDQPAGPTTLTGEITCTVE